MPGLKIVNLSKTYGNTQAVDNFSCEINGGEITVVLGPSGCGKSTLLQLITGLEKPDRGNIYWNDKLINTMPPHQRGIGLMFQDYALFPHLNAFDNLAFGLRMSGISPQTIRSRVIEVLDLVGLPGYDKRSVATLSGGEQQRVALARTLAPSPHLILLDEPLGSVDRTLRERLMFELRQILRQVGQTAVYVTHDQEEAFALADHILVMRAGKVEQFGKPQEIYHNPATLFVAQFLGFNNILQGVFTQVDGINIFETSIGSIPFVNIPKSKDGTQQVGLIRPDAARLSGEGDYQIHGILLETSFRGSQCKVIVRVQNTQLTFDLPSHLELPAVGEEINLFMDPSDSFHFFSNRPKSMIG